MEQDIRSHIMEVCQKRFGQQVEVALDIPEEQFGDYATNVAMQLAKPLGKNPREIAAEIADSIDHPTIASVDVAGPGFINITLTSGALLDSFSQTIPKTLQNQKIVAEYSDPNPFKVLHAGHFYTSIVGNAIANLLEEAGATVSRVNFGGDVGLHVAKTMYIIRQKLGGDNPDKLDDIPAADRSDWLADAYVTGTNLYEEDESAKAEITTLNKQIYQLHETGDESSPFARVYWTTRQWSYDYFDAFYERIGCQFDRYYPESTCAQKGLGIVKQHIGEVFTESNGAVVFEGEQHGLHTRVFINSEGLPTYETKDVGLIFKKHEDYQFDRSVIITGNDQLQYMEVVLKAIEQFAPELAQATTHLTHGLVKLQGSVKMSSRKGNILRATDILDEASVASQQESGNQDERVSLAAVKYAFLRTRMGGDIIYDPLESVSLRGNSGPYLQYAAVRARAILAKATTKGSRDDSDSELTAGERSLARKLSHSNAVIEHAIAELAPHLICTYLFELAQVFNRFYEDNRVIGDEREAIRLHLVEQYKTTIEHGLELLGIEAVEEM